MQDRAGDARELLRADQAIGLAGTRENRTEAGNQRLGLPVEEQLLHPARRGGEQRRDRRQSGDAQKLLGLRPRPVPAQINDVLHDGVSSLSAWLARIVVKA